MKTALEYELAKRMRSATRWVEGQQGLLPGDEPFVPPIGYGGSAPAKLDNETVYINPLGARTIYPINLQTGVADLSKSHQQLLWRDTKYLSGKWYLPDGLFSASAVGVVGVFYPFFLDNFINPQFPSFSGQDGWMDANLWDTILRGARGYIGRIRQPWHHAGLPIRSPNQIALDTNWPYGLGATSDYPHRWVTDELVNDKMTQTPVRVIASAAVSMCIRDMGFLATGVTACLKEGTPTSASETPATYCSMFSYPSTLVIKTGGLVNTSETALVGYQNNTYRVFHVQLNKAPNYVAPVIAPSSTLGAPLGAPLGG